jgi:hypothetical protein
MNAFRGLVCCVGLVVALSPLAAFADTTSEHAAAELANAAAQLQLAQAMANSLNAEGMRSADNDRMIALSLSTEMRQDALGESSNGNAIEQITRGLANFARSQGDVNARNELIILQSRATILVGKADADIANARAIGRQDEISNALAQSQVAHSLADTLTSVLAESNMSNARLIAEAEADRLHTPGIAEATNGMALGALDLLAADVTLNAGTVAASSSLITGSTRAAAVLAHANDSLKNAQAMAALANAR